MTIKENVAVAIVFLVSLPGMLYAALMKCKSRMLRRSPSHLVLGIVVGLLVTAPGAAAPGNCLGQKMPVHQCVADNSKMMETRTTRSRPWLRPASVLAVGILAIMLVGAQIAYASPTSGMPNQQCIRDATGFTQGTICTAGDVVISRFEVISGPASCIDGEQVTLTVNATLESNSEKSRYDVGLWVDQNGGDAMSNGNVCYRDYLNPITANPSPTDLTNGQGPFLNSELPPDVCGEISAKALNIYDLQEFTILCQDNDGNGKLDVGTCSSWDVTADQNLCTGTLTAKPDQSSKCNCGYTPVGNVVF